MSPWSVLKSLNSDSRFYLSCQWKKQPMMHMHLETLASLTEQAIWVFPETAKTGFPNVCLFYHCIYLNTHTDFNIKFHHFLFSGRGDKKRRQPAYRPCYGQLGEMRSLVDGTVPVVALTATATKGTREIIMTDLCLKSCIQIILNPGKANVKYSVENCRKGVTENFKWLISWNNTEVHVPGSLCFSAI